MKIQISPGEVADRLTILAIKRLRIKEPEKLAHVEYEHGLIAQAWKEAKPSVLARSLCTRLGKINRKLWEAEDAIRRCEHRKAFGTRFVRLARSVYILNDERAAIKREINIDMGSALVEEKSYAQCSAEET